MTVEDTSREAYKAARGSAYAAVIDRLVMEFFEARGAQGAADRELQDQLRTRYRVPDNSSAPARHALTLLGVLCPTNRRVVLSTGRSAKVWVHYKFATEEEKLLRDEWLARRESRKRVRESG